MRSSLGGQVARGRRLGGQVVGWAAETPLEAADELRLDGPTSTGWSRHHHCAGATTPSANRPRQ